MNQQDDIEWYLENLGDSLTNSVIESETKDETLGIKDEALLVIDSTSTSSYESLCEHFQGNEEELRKRLIGSGGEESKKLNIFYTSMWVNHQPQFLIVIVSAGFILVVLIFSSLDRSRNIETRSRNSDTRSRNSGCSRNSDTRSRNSDCSRNSDQSAATSQSQKTQTTSSQIADARSDDDQTQRSLKRNSSDSQLLKRPEQNSRGLLLSLLTLNQENKYIQNDMTRQTESSKIHLESWKRLKSSEDKGKVIFNYLEKRKIIQMQTKNIISLIK